MPLIDYARTGQCLADVPVFDCHAHIGHFPGHTSPSTAEQIAEMDRLGIDLAAISCVEALHGDIPGGNDDVAAACAAYPGRFIGYCVVTAQYPELMAEELDRCFAMDGFRGIKLYPVGTAYDHELFDPVYAFARDRQLPVLAHTWGGNVNGLDNAAVRFPEVAFLFAHAGSGFAYDAYVTVARRSPNIHLDLTYSREHTNMIEHFVSELGAGRIVWGSDTPCFSMSHQIGKVLFARIDDGDKRRILHDNAAALFGL